MSTQDTLIDLYSKHKCSDIDHDRVTRAFRENNYDAVKALPDYKEAFERVRKAKRRIEFIEEDYKESTDQALQCLAELKSVREQSTFITEDYKVTRTLIEKTLYPSWGEHQKEYVRRRQVIDEWNDLFVSYTNRDSCTTNQAYEALILREWGKKIDPAADTNNYVSRTILKYLEQSGVHSFIDYERLKCGDDIGAEICKHAATSFGLVQLIEPAIFQEPTPPKENWCLTEFKAFEKSPTPFVDRAKEHNKCFFVLARGKEFKDVDPGYPPEHLYSKWIQRANSDLRLTLNEYEDSFDDLRRDVGNIGRQIRDARRKLVDAMLGSWD